MVARNPRKKKKLGNIPRTLALKTRAIRVVFLFAPPFSHSLSLLCVYVLKCVYRDGQAIPFMMALSCGCPSAGLGVDPSPNWSGPALHMWTCANNNLVVRDTIPAKGQWILRSSPWCCCGYGARPLTRGSWFRSWPWWSHVDGGWMLMYTLQEHQMVKISRGLYYKVPHIHIVF